MKTITALLGMMLLMMSPASAQEGSPAKVAEPTPFDAAAYNELIKESKLEEAASMLDAEIAKSPDSDKLQSLDFILANRLIRVDEAAATTRLGNLVKRLSNRVSLSTAAANELHMATSSYGMLLTRKEKFDEAIGTTKQTLAKLSSAGSPALSAKRSAELQLARLLKQAGKVDEAQANLLSVFNELEKGVLGEVDAPRDLAMAANTFVALFREVAPEASSKVFQRAEQFLEQRVNTTKTIKDLEAYVTLKSSEISSRLYSDSVHGLELAKELKARLDAFESEDEKGLAAIKKRIDSYLPTLEKSAAREKLVGTEAPDYEAESFVGMEPVQIGQLRGKVVLLDFWAVWCGPCIATFPHLIDWHERFSEKGFVVLGITSDQGYEWDEQNKRAVRGKDISHEQELEMLASFRSHHRLKHGFVILPKGSTYNAKLMVSGIPQAVLIDKRGHIRMLKVGSGEANANALESEIQKLLAE